MSLSVTKLELTVLQLIQEFSQKWGGMADRYELLELSDQYGYSWNLQTIDASFGRLKTKGLLQRSSSPTANLDGQYWGAWDLTPYACELLGYDPDIIHIEPGLLT